MFKNKYYLIKFVKTEYEFFLGKFLDLDSVADPDSGPGSGMEKSRSEIRDKRPASATLDQRRSPV